MTSAAVRWRVAFPAGDLADRLDRRMILTASYLIQALGAALLLVLTPAKPPEI
jgi:hypothetical protein